jgi:hypothetical protein
VEPPTGHGSLSPKKVPDDAADLRHRCRVASRRERPASGWEAARLNQTVGSGRRGAAVTAPPSEGSAAVRPTSCNLVAPAAMEPHRPAALPHWEGPPDESVPPVAEASFF